MHCNVRFCDSSDPDCRLKRCGQNEMKRFEKQSVSQGPYTYALALSGENFALILAKTPACSEFILADLFLV